LFWHLVIGFRSLSVIPLTDLDLDILAAIEPPRGYGRD
jgi:hypothetical protein